MRTDSSFISLWEPTIAYCSGLPAFSLARVQAWRPWTAHAHAKVGQRAVQEGGQGADPAKWGSSQARSAGLHQTLVDQLTAISVCIFSLLKLFNSCSHD